MGNTNAKKSQQLGMPHGTANARLRKLILFDLLRRHGENVCFKCKAAIETVKELSIEHKQPWEGCDVALFWDLRNIAFSHLSCNRPHGYSVRGASPSRKIGPEGTAWCSGHRQFLPKVRFDKGDRWDGLKHHCKDCRASRHQQGVGR